jgi:hypothetical protein
MTRWQTTVSEDVLRERLYQDKQWGHEVDDTQNTPWMWTAYLCSYATKWMKDPFKFTREDTDEFYDRMIQTAAIAAAAAESVVRQRDRPAENPGRLYAHEKNAFVGRIAALQRTPEFVFPFSKPFRVHANCRRRSGAVRPIFGQQSFAVASCHSDIRR